MIMNKGGILRAAACVTALALFVTVVSTAGASTIVKLSLGNDNAADIAYNGSSLSTVVDADPLTPGDQNTAVEFLGALSSLPAIPAANASFTLTGVTAVGPATVLPLPNIVIQSFTGGNFSLYDNTNTLILSGTLGDSVLSGPVGASATGALFTTTLGSASGPLASLIDVNTLNLSINMTDVNGGTGFTVTTGAGVSLDPFNTDASVSLSADPKNVPEPATVTLVLLGGVALIGLRRRHA